MKVSLPADFNAVFLKKRKSQIKKEKLIEFFLLLSACVSVAITLAITFILIKEAIPFFDHVSLKEFIFSSEWSPMFEQARFGIRPLLCGTFLTTVIASSVAVPLGLLIAAFLSEFASPRVREILKPTLELLAAVPTVVYGYFALLFVTPLLQKIFPNLGSFSSLSAGLVMGVMITPYMSSLSEDAMQSVAKHLREASLALGANRLQTTFKVVIPAALSGITAAFILSVSRAIGETMVVAIAAGLQPNLTLNIFEPAATITAFIVQVSMGDLPHGSIGYQSIYAVGLTLFIFTLALNFIGSRIRKRYQERE